MRENSNKKIKYVKNLINILEHDCNSLNAINGMYHDNKLTFVQRDIWNVIEAMEREWRLNTCEWIREETPLTHAVTYHTDCGEFIGFGRINIGYKYCPYCGKLITVVDKEGNDDGSD